MILDIWAQENTNMNSCKTITLFRDIVHRYHPEFKSKSMLKLVEKHPKIFNIGHLIELTMAEVGGYDVVDAHGYDFSDGTECKTASVTPTALIIRGVRLPTYKVVISGVGRRDTGALKTGDIRVVLYNPHTTSAMFYYLPHKIYKDWPVTRNRGALEATWHYTRNLIKKWDPYKVDTFKQLAKIKPNVRTKITQ